MTTAARRVHLAAAFFGACALPTGALAAPTFPGMQITIPCTAPAAPLGQQGRDCSQWAGTMQTTRITFYTAQVNPLFVETHLQTFGTNVIQAYLDGNGDDATFAAMYSGTSSILLEPGLRVHIEVLADPRQPWVDVADMPYRPTAAYAVRAMHSDDTPALEQSIAAGDAQTLKQAIEHTDQQLQAEAMARQAGDAANLASARTYTDQQVQAEAAARMAAQGNLVALANQYTDAQIQAEAMSRAAADAQLRADLAAESAARAVAVMTVETSIANEIARAQNAEANLAATLAAETASRQSGDANLQTQLVAESQARQAGDTRVQMSLDAEIAARKQGDADTLAAANLYTDSKVAAEAAARQAADATLTTNLNNEIARAQAAETTLTTNLNNEIARAKAAEAALAMQAQTDITNLTTALNNEIARAKGAEATLQTNLNNETAARQAADTTLTNNLNAEIARAQAAEAALTTNLNNEIARAKAAEAAITMQQQADVAKLTTDLNSEIARAKAAEATLTTNLNNEIAARQAADATLTTNLNSEIAARQAADATLTTNLNNEIARAQGAETTLTANLNNEIARAKAAEAALSMQAQADVTKLTTDLNNEIARAKGAEATLTTNLNNEIARAQAAETKLTTDLNNEVSRAKAAEATLTTNLNNEIGRAQAAESTLTTNLNNEIARAKAAEAALSMQAQADVTKLTMDLNSEIARAKGAEATLQTNLNNEIARAQGAEATLTTNLNNEIARAQGAEAKLTTDLSGEISRAKAAEATLQTNLNNEIARAQGAEAKLTTDLSGEVSRAKAAEATLTTNLNNEIARAQGAEAKLTTDLGAEIARAKAAEAAITMQAQADVTKLTTDLNNEIARAKGAEATLTTNLNNEIAARQAGDTALQTSLNNEVARAQSAEMTLTTNLNAEIARAKAAEAAITAQQQADVTAINNALNAEIARAKAAEGTLQTNLNNEIARAQGAEATLTTNLNNEVARAQAAESKLTTDLNGEIARAKGAEATLQTNLNSEITRAQSAEATLTTNLNNEIARAKAAEATLQTNLNNEIAARQAADTMLTTGLSNEISARQAADTTLTNNLNAEIAARQAADTTLQTNLNNEIAARQGGDAALTANLTAETTRATNAESAIQTDLTNYKAQLKAVNANGVNNANNALDWSNLKNVPALVAGGYTAGTGISINGGVVANTGVLSVTGGGGVNVSAATGNVTFSTTAGGDLAGSLSNATLARIAGTPLAIAGLGNGQFVRYNGTSWSNSAVQPGDLAPGTYAIHISGNAATVTNGVYTTGAYVDPPWIASLAATKIAGTVANATNAVNATTAINFTGALAGDVTGTQGATTVARINGAPLGATTATAGNLLVASGTQWVSVPASGDATVAGSGAITIAANAITSAKIAPGAVTFADWNANGCAAGQIPKFDGVLWTCGTDANGGGTITSIQTGTGLIGGPITTTGTIAIANTGVVAGAYGTASSVTTFTVNAQGQLTVAGTTPIAIAGTQVTSPVANATNAVNANSAVSFTGPLAGDVTGTQAATQVVRLQGRAVSSSAPAVGQVLKWNGSSWNPDVDNNSGSVINVTASAPLSSSGGATPNISLTGVVPIGNGGTGTTTSPTGAGQFLRSTGAGAWGVAGLQASDIPDVSGNYVTIGSNQTVTGTKNFTNGLNIAGSGLTQFTWAFPQGVGSGNPRQIHFGSDPYGGSGDNAYIQYRSEGGENMVLEIVHNNDADDNISIQAPGGVDVGNALRVAGTISGNGSGLTSLNAGALSGIVPIANGGTGISTAPTAAGQYHRSTGAGVWGVSGIQAGDLPSLSGSYVDLGSAQTVGGAKTWTGAATFNAGVTANQVNTSILYDRDNTGYYVDPHATSLVNRLAANRNGALYDGPYGAADLLVGDGGNDRRGYGAAGGSSIFLRSSAKSTITALDENHNLGQIAYENLVWTIGENIGWGAQTVNMPGNVNVGGVLSGNGSGITSINPANIAGGTANINISGNAATATNATNFTGALAGDVTGSQGATTVVRLQGRALSNAAPAVGQVIRWDGAAWAPGVISGSDNLGNHNATTRIQPTVGNSAGAGIQWPSDPGGGGGDEAFLRYYVEGGENTKFLIGTNNDGDDDLSFYQAGAERLTIYNGNVGIGTTAPAAPLHINGDYYALVGPNSTWGQYLKLGGNGWAAGHASVVTTNGNLHIDAKTGNEMYLNYYAGNVIHFGNGGQADRARIDGSGMVLGAGSYQGNGSGLTNLNASNLSAGTVPVGVMSGTYNINVSGQAQYLRFIDNRTLAPNSSGHGQMQFGFTAFNNNNAAPWADYLLLNSYTDASGGSDNLLTFSRSSIAARLWQQTWNSGTPFGSYKDFAFIQDGVSQFANNAGYHTGNGSANTIAKYTGGTTLGNSLITDDGTTTTATGQFDVGGGTGTVYHTAPIEVRTTNTPRVSFHWPGVVASQIGMDNAGTIRTYDNPGTGYANFAAASINGTVFVDRDPGSCVVDPSATSLVQYEVGNKWTGRDLGQGAVFMGTQDQNGNGLLPGQSGIKYPVFGATGANLYLSINGTYTGYWSPGGYTQVSDERMKTNIRDLGGEDLRKAVADLEGIRTIWFHYKQELRDGAVPATGVPLHLGVIAQTLPDGVRGYDATTSTYGLNTADMLGFLVAAVRGVRAEQKAALAEVGQRLERAAADRADADRVVVEELRRSLAERDEELRALRVRDMNLQAQIEALTKRLDALESR